MTTTAICNSFKVEMMQGGHCFNATQSSLAGAGVSGAFTITGLATTAGVAVGMAASGTGVASGAIVASIDSATQVTVSKAHTGTVTTGTIGFAGDSFKILLVKVGAATNFGASQTNIGTTSGASSTTNVGTDEMTNTSGTAYTAGGYLFTNNTTPVLSGSTAVGTFPSNPSWSTASFSTIGAILYNTSTRLGAGATPLNGRTISVHDFAGTQSVATGTFTLVMPTAAAGSALLQIA